MDENTTVATTLPADGYQGGMVQTASPKAQPIRIHMAPEKMQTLEVGLWMDAQEGDVAAMVRVLAHFVINEHGHWMTDKDGLAAVRQMTFEQLAEKTEEMRALAEETAAPKAPESA
jgi:hypothetical protein